MCLSFSVWITTACNLRCIYCYEGEKKQKLNLSVQQASAIVDYIQKKVIKVERLRKKKVEKLNIELHGGEPLINFQGVKDFVDKANKVLKGYEISYQMTTNGTILNDGIVDFLKKNKIQLTISIDGDKCTQDFCRRDIKGNGTYNLVIENSLKLLQIYGNSLRVRMTFNSKTVKRLSENVFHLAELGFKIIIALPDIFDKSWNDEKMCILDSEIQKIKQHYIDESVFINLRQPVVLQKKGTCSCGIEGENILPNGDIYCCTMATGNKEFKIGNIKMGIDKNIVQKILYHSMQTMEACSECTFTLYCDCIRCKIINKLVNDNYYQPIGVQCALNNILLKYNGYEKVS